VFTAFCSDDPGEVAEVERRWREAGASALQSNGNCVVQASDSALILSAPDLLMAGAARLDQLDGADVASSDSALNQLRSIRSVLLPSPQTRITKLKGEFAFVAWQPASRTFVAARDPIGLRTVYYRECAGGVYVSDCLDGIERSGEHDKEFVAEFIASGGCCSDRTIWKDIRPLPPGTLLIYSAGRLAFHEYWSPRTFAPSTGRADDLGRELYRLAESAVVRSLDPGTRTWAHLSGGLDSSSIVCIASAAHRAGRAEPALGGTITCVDSLSNGDETAFADEVVSKFGLPNVRVCDDWPWRGDGVSPPITDQPARDYPLYGRDRRMADVILSQGGTVLLSGVGPDVYFPVTPVYLADWLSGGHVRKSVTGACQWSLATSESIWKTTTNQLVAPFLPRPIRRAFREKARSAPDWLTPAFVKRTDFTERLRSPDQLFSRPGKRYLDFLTHSFKQVSGSLPQWHPLPGVETRHPWLSQTVVEFVLRLPLELRTHPYSSKRALRISMKGVLPETVSRRTTKGTLQPRVCWAFAKERGRLAALLKDSILASIGCIDPGRVSATLNDWSTSVGRHPVHLHSMLALETWLSVRSGRCVPELSQL
jgi:asparagine synthase (glutamine-hydrolysing)